MSENMFLDIIADVNSDYVEEALFMPQIEQDSEDLQKYRKKSNVGKIFGTAAACVAIIGVGIAAILLHNSGFFTEPAQNTEAITTTEAESEMTTTAETDETQTTPEETQAEEKKVYVYGEVEIPDIPSASDNEDGFAHDIIDFIDRSEDFSECLDSMVFETHTVGEYKISLVGDSVRTDKKNFPDCIYVKELRVEVEKNGERLFAAYSIEPSLENAYAYYYDLDSAIGAQSFYREFRLFTDKIGTYIDLYELEQPVIAMRYYCGDNPKRIIKQTVQFSILYNDKIHYGFVGIAGKNTGVADADEIIDDNAAIPNDKDGVASLISLSEAEKLKIIDAKTLMDEEAGIKYTFDFSDPAKMEQYTSEKINVTAYIPECLNSLEGIPGDVVASNITNIEYSSENPDVWGMAECEGFAYMADFAQSPENYQRYYVGDKIGDFTVKTAKISFMNMSEENVADKCRKNMSVSLEGTVTLTGAFYIPEKDVLANPEYNVYFYPDEESRKKLPLFCGFNGFTGTENGDDRVLYSDFKFYDEEPEINLGFSEEFDNWEEKKSVKVKATITDLKYNFAMGGPIDSWSDAVLVDYEVIE